MQVWGLCPAFDGPHHGRIPLARAGRYASSEVESACDLGSTYRKVDHTATPSSAIVVYLAGNNLGC